MSDTRERAREAAFLAVRRELDASGYGGWVNDQKCREISDRVADDVISTLNKKQPLQP